MCGSSFVQSSTICVSNVNGTRADPLDELLQVAGNKLTLTLFLFHSSFQLLYLYPKYYEVGAFVFRFDI